MREHRSAEWQAGCSCDTQVRRPCVVLDPFSGSATTGTVAMKYNQDYVGIDLNPEYAALAKARLVGAKAPEEGDSPMEGAALDLFGGTDGP